MFRNKSTLKLLFTCLFVFTYLFAEPNRERIGGEHKKKEGHKWGIEKITTLLNLNEEQKKRVNDIHLQSSQETQQKKIKIERLQLDIKEAMLAKQPNEISILSTVDKIFNLKAEISKIEYKNQIKIIAILDEEQKKKMIQFLFNVNKWKDHRKKGGKKRF